MRIIDIISCLAIVSKGFALPISDEEKQNAYVFNYVESTHESVNRQAVNFVVVKLDLEKDFNITGLNPVHYELGEPTEDHIQSIAAYEKAVSDNDLETAVINVFKMAAMITDLEKLIADVGKDKTYYKKFVDDNLIREIKLNNVEKLSEDDLTLEKELFETFLNAPESENEDDLEFQI